MYAFVKTKLQKIRKTHNKTTAEGSCSKAQAKYHKGGNQFFGDFHRAQTSVSHCLHCNKVLKLTLYFLMLAKQCVL